MELRPLPARAAGALLKGREQASLILGAAAPPEWPQSDLSDLLALQTAASPSDERFGVWVMIDLAQAGDSGRE